jgi:hypothetical protein
VLHARLPPVSNIHISVFPTVTGRSLLPSGSRRVATVNLLLRRGPVLVRRAAFRMGGDCRRILKVLGMDLAAIVLKQSGVCIWQNPRIDQPQSSRRQVREGQAARWALWALKIGKSLTQKGQLYRHHCACDRLRFRRSKGGLMSIIGPQKGRAVAPDTGFAQSIRQAAKRPGLGSECAFGFESSTASTRKHR